MSKEFTYTMRESEVDTLMWGRAKTFKPNEECPYGHTKNGDVRMIGSVACYQCGYRIAIDESNMKVLCGYDDNKH